MIGQTNLINNVSKLIEDNKLNRFILIVGPRHSGKKYISKYICKLLDLPYIIADNKVEDIRNIIEQAYSTIYKQVLLIYDLQDYNYRAKESILKITEEPPEDKYIIITCNSLNGIKQTIKNRALILTTDYYMPNELKEFAQSKNINISKINLSLCSTPTLIEMLLDNRNLYKKYNDYSNYFIKMINQLSGAQSLKIVNEFDTKGNSEDCFDVDLFFIFLYENISLQKTRFIIDEDKSLPEFVLTLLRLIINFKDDMLKINGVSKYALLTMFILDYRKVCRKYGFIGIEE